MNQSQHALTKENAIRHCQRGNKSRSMYTSKFQMDKIHSKQLTSNSNKISHTVPSNSSVINSNKYNIIQTINVITRNRPQIETSTRPIVKRTSSSKQEKQHTEEYNGQIINKTTLSYH